MGLRPSVRHQQQGKRIAAAREAKRDGSLGGGQQPPVEDGRDLGV